MSVPKSLHTVTSVSRVALHLMDTNPIVTRPGQAVERAGWILGQPLTPKDPLFPKCVTALTKLIKAS